MTTCSRPVTKFWVCPKCRSLAMHGPARASVGAAETPFPGVGAQMSVVTEKLNVVHRWGSAKAERGHRWSGGKRSSIHGLTARRGHGKTRQGQKVERGQNGVTEKLYGVTDGGRQKLNRVTNGAPEKGRWGHTFRSRGFARALGFARASRPPPLLG